MPSIARAVRKTRGRRFRGRVSVTIQVHAKFPVPAGFTLAPSVVEEMLEHWMDTGRIPNWVDISAVDYRITETNQNGVEHVREDSTLNGADAAEVRHKLIARFRPYGSIATLRVLGADS